VMIKKGDDTVVASRNTESEIGTALTRRPKPKPVLSLAELLAIVWLRSTPSASTKEVNPSTTGVDRREPRTADTE